MTETTTSVSLAESARRTFQLEARAIEELAGNLTSDFEHAVQAILKAKGKTIVCGMGKSGHIGKKIAATLASTGTPSFFLHPAEAFHGDLGMIGEEDILILISYSGETEEILRLIPHLKEREIPIVAMTGNNTSTLAKNANYTLNVKVSAEACPLSLAPTASTTATLVMGDAIAIALMEQRGFKPDDFARFHPGGTLGKRLLGKVKEYTRYDNLPFVRFDANVREVIYKLAEGRLGLVLTTGPKASPKGLPRPEAIKQGLGQARSPMQ